MLGLLHFVIPLPHSHVYYKSWSSTFSMHLKVNLPKYLLERYYLDRSPYIMHRWPSTPMQVSSVWHFSSPWNTWQNDDCSLCHRVQMSQFHKHSKLFSFSRKFKSGWESSRSSTSLMSRIDCINFTWDPSKNPTIPTQLPLTHNISQH
jgi:hypothetical protein